jgi:hypothetical protein
LTSSGVLVINSHAEEKLEKQSQLLKPILTKKLMKKNYLLTGFIASAVVLFASNALASTAAQIFTDPIYTFATYDNASGAYPVVTAILSRQGAVSGTHTYTSTSLLAQDSTGSLDIFSINETLYGYSPQVGDTIYAQGQFSPFHQIPEMSMFQSSSNAANIFQTGVGSVPSPSVFTIPQLNVATLPQGIAGHLIQLNNVTIGGSGGVGGLFPTYAQATTATETFTITDGSANSMTLFDWVTSYSSSGAFGGQAVPTGPVDIIGFDSVFTSGSTSTAEFTPISITLVPEPSTLALSALGGLALLLKFRRQK